MSQRGFTILEMLGVLVLLAMVALVTDRVFMQAMHGIADQRTRQWHDAARQSLEDHLRADVWTSTSAQAADGSLHLSSPAGQIIYRIEPRQIRRLAPGEADMRWEQPGQAAFAVSGGLITLKTPAPAGVPARTLTFVAPIIGQGGKQ